MRSNDMNDDEILRRYLLGTLGEEEADDLECRLLADGELFELAEAVEGDLLAAAARGDLSPAERGRVLRRLAASPEGRARLALARGLSSLGREQVSAEVLVFQLLARPGVRAAAVAASLVFVAGGLWVATQFPRPLPTNAIFRESSPAILQLALSTVRSAGEPFSRVTLPIGTNELEIRLPLAPGEPSTSFAAILRNASTEEEIRREERLAARQVDGRRAIVLSVPAADLEPGIYEVEVRTTEGDELLGRPIFEVASTNSPSRASGGGNP